MNPDEIVVGFDPAGEDASLVVVTDETHFHTEAELREGLQAIEEAERPLNRAERRAQARRVGFSYFAARLRQRPFRRAFSDWTGTMRVLHGISPVA